MTFSYQFKQHSVTYIEVKIQLEVLGLEVREDLLLRRAINNKFTFGLQFQSKLLVQNNVGQQCSDSWHYPPGDDVSSGQEPCPQEARGPSSPLRLLQGSVQPPRVPAVGLLHSLQQPSCRQ